MEIKRLNWFKRQNAWDVAQAWRRKRAVENEKFFASSAVFASSFAGAQNNLSSGMATLSAQASIQRVQDKIKSVVSGQVGGNVNLQA